MHDAIAEDACRAAPVEFAETVQKLIQAERAKAPKNPDKAQQLVPFYVLRRIEKCWGNSAIKEIVFAELQSPENSPWQFQALLEPLLEAGFDPAELAIATLAETGPERRGFVLAAAFGLASFSAIHVWPKIWTLVLEREDIGKELFLQLAEHRRFQATFYVGLPEPALGDLYLWLAQKFPHSEEYLAFAWWPLGEVDRAISLVDGGQGWRVAWLASSRALASASAHCWAADGRSSTYCGHSRPQPWRLCKITNGFRSQWGAALYADIRSVVETARRRSIRAIDAIRLTLGGRPLPCAA